MSRPDDEGSAFDHVLKANIARVFNEHDRDARDRAIAELWGEDAQMIETDEVLRGRKEISDAVGRLLERLPPGLRFEAVGNAIVNHGTALLHWRAGVPGEAMAVAGNDVAYVQDGKIQRLYVYLEPGPR